MCPLLNRHFSKMATKHTTSYPVSLVIKEIQTKITLRALILPTKIPNIERTDKIRW